MTFVERLVDALSSTDPNRRQRAAMQLGALDVSPVMPRLVEAMASEPDDFVRETLIWAVVARPAAAAPALVDALGHDLPHEPVLHALSKIGDPETAEAIVPWAQHPDDAVAAKAWWALARIGAPVALPTLLPHLGAERAERRHGLTRALLELGQTVIDPLADALTDPSPAVRSHAAEVLVALADPTRYGVRERQSGEKHAGRAAAVLRSATASEVDGALLLATVSDDRPGLVAAAERLREERAQR